MVETKDSPKSIPIRARSLQVMLREGRWRLESFRSRDEHAFLWITRGQGRLSIDTQTRGIGPNTIIHIPAGRPHAIRLAPTAQGHAVHAHRDLKMPVPDGPVAIRAANVFEQGQITTYFDSLQAEVTAGEPGVEQAAESYLTLVCVWIERHLRYNDWPPGDGTRAAKLMSGFMAEIERDGSRLRPVSEVAAALCVTPTHLTRLCQEAFGRSALEMIQDRVILEACLHLRDGSETVADISRRLGFASPTYFNRLFRSRQSVTPLNFRHLGESAAESRSGRRVMR